LRQIYAEAQELRAHSRYEDALQRHLWLHRHALETDPGYSAVRLSFWLSDWAELGRHYPKAKQALMEIRDHDTQELAAGRGHLDMFMDVDRIDAYLQDEAATLALFKRIEQSDPQLAKQCAPLMNTGAGTSAVSQAPKERQPSDATAISQKGWRERFEAAYRLQDGELVKHIQPPYVPERLEYYRNVDTAQAQAIPEPPNYFTFHQNDQALREWGCGFIGSDRHTLYRVLRDVFKLKRYDIEGSAVLLDLSFEGDWTLREETETKALLAVLETVLRAETKRNIHFEKRAVEREVIVAKGAIRSASERDESIRIYAENSSDTGGGGGSGDLGEFLAHVGDRLGVPFVNEVTGGEQKGIAWENHMDANYVDMGPRLDEFTAKVLKNLAAQTGLSFTREKRRVEVWFVSEQQ
jgi:hypothetical protein